MRRSAIAVTLLSLSSPAISQVKPSQTVAPINNPRFTGTVKADKIEVVGQSPVGGSPVPRMSFGFDVTSNSMEVRDEIGNATRARISRDGGGISLDGQYVSLTFNDPVTGRANGGSHRLTSAGNGTFVYQIMGGANAFSIAPSGLMTIPNLEGDVSNTTVTPNINAPATSLSGLMARRLSITGNDLTTNSDESIADKLPFANTGSKHFLFSRRPAPVNAALGTSAIIRKSVGSGTFGPGSADFALMTSAEKEDWQTNPNEGEIDTQIIIARQGKMGDTTPLALDVLKRRDVINVVGPGENGGAIGYEISAGMVNSAGVPYHRISTYSGMIESPLGLSKGRGFGFLTTTRAGDWYAAYGATVRPAGEDGGLAAPGAVTLPNSYQNFLVYDSTGDYSGSGVVYRVDGAGTTFQGLPDKLISTGFERGIDAMAWKNPAAGYLMTLGRTTGVLSVSNGIQIGSGAVKQYQNAVKGTYDPPSLAAFETRDLVSISAPGARPGDMVTATVTSFADTSHQNVMLSGIVYGNDTVVLRAYNKTNAALDPSPLNYVLEIKRY